MSAQRIGSILMESGKINLEQLETAMQRQSGTSRQIGDVLQEMGYITDEDVAKALARQLNVAYFDLGEDFKLEQEEVRLIPEAIARRFCLIPVKKDKGPILTVVMSDPIDVDALDTVRSLTKLEVHKAVATSARIRSVIDRFYKEEAHIERSLRDIVHLEAGEPETVAPSEEADADQLRVLANDAPVVRFVNLLLMNAVRDGASDIHFEPGEKEITIRMRVDGYLREVTPPPKSLYPAIVTRIKILSGLDIGERRLPQDGRFKFKVHERFIDVRVSSLPEVFGEKIVLRILDRASLVVDMRDIGFEGETLVNFQRILERPHGIILLTGPTGSGKTTTLYSALTYLKKVSLNIQTVEDPVEYILPGVNQMQVKEKIGLDFASALRSILRQDPDIIMIGEMRDLETARMAMRASLTGHLVLSTLHTNDASSAFSRLHDVGIESYLIAATVNLVISQRLVRKICPHCRTAVTPEPGNLDMIKSLCPDASDWTYYRGKGCEHCGHSGYRGRLALIEFLEVTDPIRQLILGHAGDLLVKAKALELGMKPLVLDGLERVRQGITTLDEVASVCAVDEMGGS